MSLEQKINQKLNQYPVIKKKIKRIYQRSIYILSPKIKSEGDIFRLSPADQYEYFFGYYDKCPWDSSGRYVLCLRAKDTWSNVAPKDPADIILIDTKKENSVHMIAKTHSWNVQQGCMAQWLGPKFDREIIYNDYRDGKYCAVILDMLSGNERQLALPVYSVSQDGKTALSLDFSRLHRLRPGYGYSNISDRTMQESIPDGPCIWSIDIRTNHIKPLLHYKDLTVFDPRPEMKGAVHKVNHLMFSPDGKRFMFLHRWILGSRKYSRLITCNADGTELFNLSDDDMVSHCFWKNDNEILAFENKRGYGAGYYLMQDRSNNFKRLWLELTGDGHPSYSPDGRLVVTDTYPNRARIADIKVMDGDDVKTVARVFAPFKYDNDTRCDLHPRWNRNGRQICFDAVFEGHRGLYTVNIEGLI